MAGSDIVFNSGLCYQLENPINLHKLYNNNTSSYNKFVCVNVAQQIRAHAKCSRHGQTEDVRYNADNS